MPFPALPLGPIELPIPVRGVPGQREVMVAQHPDLDLEQAHIDHAYACLARARTDALDLRNLTSVERGGTHQARWEAEAYEGAITHRLAQLELYDAALVFGRIDRVGEPNGVEGHFEHEAFHIGRVAVSDEEREPVVVDWRAPVAEPFYRATGREPMGLARRRHFSVRGKRLLGIEDELFGEGHLGIGADDGLQLRGYSTLIAALELGRTGQLGDIVATIQAEQDEIIRSPQAGVLVVQGGPGTGKTVVALHRAAYLLYSNRFPLADQGVLVVGPNRLFLRYISQVLPSLGEAGVEEVMLIDLIPDAKFGSTDTHAAAVVKGDVRMSNVLSKAVRDRQRPLRADLAVPFGIGRVRLTVAQSEHIIQAARRRFRRHNSARKFVEQEVFAVLAASRPGVELDAGNVREKLRNDESIKLALERMWPLLAPAELLNDLLGSLPLLKLASLKWLSQAEYTALHRTRTPRYADVVWTNADGPLLDEARALLGPKADKKGKPDMADEIRTFGHIVIDEVQDLTPMELRMCERRSLGGSMTVVGDIGQATGAHAPADWNDVLRHLPDRKEPRLAELTVGYRIPATAMELAARVLALAAPQLHPPISVRAGESDPFRVPITGWSELAAEVVTMLERVGEGNVAVISPVSMTREISAALEADGITVGHVRDGLDARVTVIPVNLVKGLELDGVIVVEPAAILREEPQGLRSLYVALTRATRHLALVHREPLPEVVR